MYGRVAPQGFGFPGNPNTGIVPPGMGSPMGQGAQGFLQGYPGPMPGTPEFQAAQAAGRNPLVEWLQANHGGQNGLSGVMGGALPGMPMASTNNALAPRAEGPTNGLGRLAAPRYLQSAKY